MNPTSAEAWGRVPARNTPRRPSGSHRAQLAHFPLELRDPLLIPGRDTGPLAAVDFRLLDPGPQSLRMNTQLPAHPGQLPMTLPVPLTDLEHHLHRAFTQLVRVLLLCCHGPASS